MFIELPTVGSGTAAITGQDLSAFSGATVMSDLTAIVNEPTLIETIAWSAQKFSTHVGMLVLAVSDGTHRRLVGAYELAAGTAALFASGTVAVNFVVPPGYKLVAAHNVQDAGSAFTDVNFVPFGGVVRAPGVLYGTTLPDPDVFFRGKTFTVFGGAGAPDYSFICLKQSDGSYAWSAVVGSQATVAVYTTATLPDPSSVPLKTIVANIETNQLLINYTTAGWTALS
jgi:hypothetical protein